MNYNTSRLSDNVNNNINRRRRAIGKGSRETLYRNLCKTHLEPINSALRDIARHRVGNTYGEVWNLNTGKSSLLKNRLPLLALAHIFANKVGGAPAIAVVADFITFVMMHHNLPVEDVVSVASPPLLLLLLLLLFLLLLPSSLCPFLTMMAMTTGNPLLTPSKYIKLKNKYKFYCIVFLLSLFMRNFYL